MKNKLCAITVITTILFLLVVLSGCSSQTVFIEYPVSSSQSLDQQLATMTVQELTQNMDYYYQQSLNSNTDSDTRVLNASYAVIYQNELDVRTLKGFNK